MTTPNPIAAWWIESALVSLRVWDTALRSLQPAFGAMAERDAAPAPEAIAAPNESGAPVRVLAAAERSGAAAKHRLGRSKPRGRPTARSPSRRPPKRANRLGKRSSA
jgi:hypothetical protein